MNLPDSIDPFSNVAKKKIAHILANGGKIVAIQVDNNDGMIGTIDCWGKVTWEAHTCKPSHKTSN